MAGIEFAEFGVMLGQQLGIGSFAGGILMSLIFTCLFLFPVLFLCRKSPTIPALIVGVGTEVCCVAFTWLPAWVLLVTFIAVALMFAGSARDWISGRSGGG